MKMKIVHIVILLALTIWSFAAALGDFMQLSALLRWVNIGLGLVFAGLFIAHLRGLGKDVSTRHRG